MYGISSEVYERLFQFQGSKCAICGREKPNGRFTKMYVDHCHNTGRIRGLLCHPCNWAVGYVECKKFKTAMTYLVDTPFDRFCELNPDVEIT
jgi:hypothetical protein